MNHEWWLMLAFLGAPIVCAQQMDKVQPIETGRSKATFSKPMRVAQEVASTARDFASFRDPAWSALTLAQIGAASADAVTSLNNLRSCPTCTENGFSRFFVGRRPDTHKYLIGGTVEIGVEAFAAHYFRTHGPTRKWYWKILWTLPQSFSLYEHVRAAHHNARLDLGCAPPAPTCD
jgi:hypothetical protein